jgi:hypothetical protein
MSGAGVPPNKMDGPYELDDASIEALLAGDGHAVDPLLADLLGDLRATSTARTPRVRADLAALMGAPVNKATATSSSTPTKRRIRSRLAKLGAAAAAAVVAATGGLAVAGALPPPIQNALSQIGLPTASSGPSHHHPVDTTPITQPTTAADPTTTTTAAPTTTVADAPASGQVGHGRIVAGIAHNHTTQGCAHGHDVGAGASEGKSNGQPCHNTSTNLPSHTPPNNAPHNNNATHNTPHNTDNNNGQPSQPGIQHNANQPNRSHGGSRGGN